jgi:aminoglycoside phosphotransferase (APT) family kinase protein
MNPIETVIKNTDRRINTADEALGIGWDNPEYDLVPGNVLVCGGHLAGVLDVGGLGPADPALDLVSAWHLLEAGPRRVLRVLLGSNDLEWERGRAWAFQQSVGLVWYYVDSNPVMSQIGRRTLAHLAADVS